MSTRELKEEAKDYIELLYRQHKEDDVVAWDHLIDVIFLYIDQAVREHAERHHKE